MTEPTRPKRVDRVLDVTLRDSDDYPKLVRLSKTVNLGQHGILMEVPALLDAVQGEDIVVRLRWAEGTFESPGRIVRFESPYRGDPARSVMGIELTRDLPPALLADEGAASVGQFSAA